MRIVDWLARTAMLVLAALATLALIGSLASVSNAPIGNAFPGMIAEPAPSPAADGTLPDVATPASPPQVIADGNATMTMAPATAADPSPRAHEIARWLKALTYAVIALAVVSAAGVIALVRIAAQLRRIAER